MRSKHRKIRSCAILIGYDPNGKCIYSEAIDLADYYDGEHVWDSDENVKRMKLQRMKGYLFDSDGILAQGFECVFDLRTGMVKRGHARFADGTVHNH
jgi:hypothetical protein